MHRSKEATTPFLTTVIALVGGIAAIAITHIIHRRQDEKEKKIYEAKVQAFFKMERKRSMTKLSDTLNQDGTVLRDVKIDRIVLWDVATLKTRFKSEAPKGFVNHMDSNNATPLPHNMPTFSKRNVTSSPDAKETNTITKTHSHPSVIL